MPEKLLGKLPAKRDSRNLLAARYMAPREAPPAYDFEKGRAHLPARTFGNTRYGDCTRASQANALMRLERVEQRRTIVLADQVVVDAYLKMTGGADDGAYELDALKAWRDPGFPGGRVDRSYTIDAFTQVRIDADEIKAAVATFGGVKVCLSLPKAWQDVDPTDDLEASAWTVKDGPEGEPGSWGGHSLYADAYRPEGLIVVHSWYESPTAIRQLVTWDAVAKYADECYSVVDSLDKWRKRGRPQLDIERLRVDLADATAAA